MRPRNSGFDNSKMLISPKTHQAVVYGVANLGTQRNEYMGEPKVNHQVAILFEIPGETYEDKEGNHVPKTIHVINNFFYSEKATLRKNIEAILGRSMTAEETSGDNMFNIEDLIGKNCQLTIEQKEKGERVNNRVTQVASLMDGIPAKAATRPNIVLDIEQFTTKADVLASRHYQGAPRLVKFILEKSDEWQELTGGEEDKANPDAGLPESSAPAQAVPSAPAPTGEEDDLPF